MARKQIRALTGVGVVSVLSAQARRPKMHRKDNKVAFEVGDVRLVIDLNHGARISDLSIADLHLLVPRNHPDIASENPALSWGSYPMAPWTGRIRHGRFSHAGKTYQMPLTLPPHAIHGTTFQLRWQQLGDAPVFQTDLGPHWPFAGRAIQRFDLGPDTLTCTLEVHSDQEPFPAACGWHPWFLRQLSRGEALLLDFQAESMYQQSEEQVILQERVAPTPGPWDDCFCGVSQPVTLHWPGALKLHLSSELEDWVVYSQPRHALCVEPQTGPPNSINSAPRLVSPQAPLIATMHMRWQRL